jgi:DNA-binding IclR family transcriptional regulator
MAALERGFRILDLLTRVPEPLGVSAIARRLKLPKSTTLGLLRELSAAGAVEAGRAGYRLGPLVPRLAATVELRRRWRPVLVRLADEVGETAFLGQPRGARVAVIDEVLGAGGPIVSAPVGSYVPSSAGAIGKVLAGADVAEDRGEYLAGVNAVAAAVPGGAIWVAGFADRLTAQRLAPVASLIRGLTSQP